MRTKLILCFLLFATGIFANGTGEVIITEIHNRPDKPTSAELAAAIPNNPPNSNGTSPNEGHTEWFEVYNTTSLPVIMDGWILQDVSNNNTHVITSFTLAPNSYAVFSGFNIPAAHGGIVFDYFYDYKVPSFNNESTYTTSSNVATNCPDGIRIEKPGGTLVDEVAYDYGYGTYLASGACPGYTSAIGLPGMGSNSRTSFMLNFDPAVMNCNDNDLAANWSFSTIQYDNNQTGTPGLANDGSAPPPSAVPVPTLSEWGLIILGLIMVNITLLLQMAPKMTTSNGQTVTTGINFRELPFNRNSFFKAWMKIALLFLAIFTVASVFFGYELTSADPIGGLIASGVLAYTFMLLGNRKQEA